VPLLCRYWTGFCKFEIYKFICKFFSAFLIWLWNFLFSSCNISISIINELDKIYIMFTLYLCETMVLRVKNFEFKVIFHHLLQYSLKQSLNLPSCGLPLQQNGEKKYIYFILPFSRGYFREFNEHQKNMTVIWNCGFLYECQGLVLLYLVSVSGS
jgi:hypothetical protein